MTHSVEGAVERLSRLFDCSRFEEDYPERAPHEDVLRSLLSADADRLTWLLAPDGRSLGLGAAGEGDAFARAVADPVDEMLTPAAGDAFAGLVLESPPAGIELEMVLGDTTWFRAGVGVEDFETLRGTLEAVSAHPETVDRALRHEDTPGADPTGVYLAQAPPDPWGVQVSVSLPADAAGDLGGDAVGDSPVVVDDTVAVGRPDDPSPERRDGETATLDDRTAGSVGVGDPGPEETLRTWIRRPGLSGADLVDWQFARLIDTADVERVGTVLEALDVHGPTDVVWERGDLQGSLVYVYPHTGT